MRDSCPKHTSSRHRGEENLHGLESRCTSPPASEKVFQVPHHILFLQSGCFIGLVRDRILNPLHFGATRSQLGILSWPALRRSFVCKLSALVFLRLQAHTEFVHPLVSGSGQIALLRGKFCEIELFLVPKIFSFGQIVHYIMLKNMAQRKKPSSLHSSKRIGSSPVPTEQMRDDDGEKNFKPTKQRKYISVKQQFPFLYPFFFLLLC